MHRDRLPWLGMKGSPNERWAIARKSGEINEPCGRTRIPVGGPA